MGAPQELDHFNVEDNDLNLLLNLAGDLLTDQGNMDTALMFAHYLEVVEERLRRGKDEDRLQETDSTGASN